MAGLARGFCMGRLDQNIGSAPHHHGASIRLPRFWQPALSAEDHSTNNLILAIPTFGESWHNNNHAFPAPPCTDWNGGSDINGFHDQIYAQSWDCVGVKIASENNLRIDLEPEAQHRKSSEGKF